MKGQAFIGLPNEKAAAKALKEVNGYALFDKPMVVVSFLKVFSQCVSIKLAGFQILTFRRIHIQSDQGCFR